MHVVTSAYKAVLAPSESVSTINGSAKRENKLTQNSDEAVVRKREFNKCDTDDSENGEYFCYFKGNLKYFNT